MSGMSGVFVQAVSSLGPGGRYMMQHSGADLAHTPWWVLIVSGSAALFMVVILLKDRLSRR